MTFLDRLFRGGKGNQDTRATAAPIRRRAQPGVEALEERSVPSVVSSISANFNPTAIPAGDTVWFNASFTANGLPKTSPATIHVENGTINFTAGGAAYQVAVPNGVIVLTPGATSASATYTPSDNDWDVSAPSGVPGNVFMGGVELAVPNGLPGGIQNVTWSASFWSDTPGLTVNWRWAAAVYNGFSTDYNALGVKPVDNNTQSVYQNGDKAGTPEAFKGLDVAGALGNGGNNFTGNFTPAKGVQPSLGDGVQDYPYPSSNPLTSIAFNESSVLKAANLDTTNGYFDVWYSDEHALALGVGQVNVITSSGTTTTNYPIAPLTSDPGSAINPALGTTATTGDQAGTDVSGRPMAPSLFITDTTNDPNNRSGDWQWGGAAYAPSAVFGTWKSFTRTVNYTTGTPVVTVTGAVDPAKNGWNLGAGADAAPAGLTNEGYGAEMRWDLNALYQQGILLPGHTYRFYVFVHDGDQNKVGGDAGQAAFTYTYPGPTNLPASVSGFVFNGTQGGPIAGVTLTLYQQVNGQFVAVGTTTTAPDGSYSFFKLQPGVYQVVQTPPAPPLGFSTESTSSAAGTVNNVVDGSAAGDVIGGINLGFGNNGVNYNFMDMFGGS